MSRSNPNSGNNPSPVQLRLRFHGSTGAIQYYDKASNSNPTQDSIDLVLLDVRASVSGFNEAANSQIWSNLVKSFDLPKIELTVKTSKGQIAKGFWKDIKDEVAKAGGDYTVNLIALGKWGEEWKIVSLPLSGSSLQAWMDFEKLNKIDDIYASVLTVTKDKDIRKKGATKYYVPEFSLSKLDGKLEEKAIEADKVLQAYFDQFEGAVSANQPAPAAASAPASAPFEPATNFNEEEHDDLPF